MSTTTSTSTVPPGIYRILVADSVEPALLTNGKDYVTIDSPGAQPDSEQEWQIRTVDNSGSGYIVIRPSKLDSFLSYRGAPEEPKEGERVELHNNESTEWQYSAGSEYRYSLRTASGSNLGIKIGPLTIHPPHLVLGEEHQLYWRFEFVRPEEL